MSSLQCSGPFADLVAGFDALLGATDNEIEILAAGTRLLAELVAKDDWLPETFARPDPARYTQFLLYRDPGQRFSVVSFVWGPGQKTPIHDHTVWGLVGVLRGAEFSQKLRLTRGELQPVGEIDRLEPGHVDAVSPRIGDIHQVSNAFDDRVSVSIHVYGADIGKVARHVYSPDGNIKTFVSGYSNPEGPVLLEDVESAAATHQISPLAVRRDLITRREIAILDLREEGLFALAHPLFAVNLPLSRLELEILDRVPRKTTKIVLYGEGLVETARLQLVALGYNSVHVLEGGVRGWKSQGFELFQNVNSASKAFGEFVESSRHTPSLPATEAQALIQNDPNVVVLDARRFEEYRTMSIPKGISVPGAELVLRAHTIAPDSSTTIVVNCAGRTRSIIGAQSLINAGLPNRVVALRNGTIGWTLAGQTLDHGQTRRFPEPSAAAEKQAQAAARSVAYRAGVKRIDWSGVAELSADTNRSLYRFDVRTPEEYEAGHIDGFRSAPGGQLVQETDIFAPVRGARIVLADDRHARADMTASWLAQMGWEVYVLESGAGAPLAQGGWQARYPNPPAVWTIKPSDLNIRLGDAVLIDLAPSPVHRRGHIAGAWFAVRSRLKGALQRLPSNRNFILTSPDGVLAQFAAAELETLSGREVLVLAGGTAAWAACGGPLETGLTHAASDTDDVYQRPYEGTENAASAMQAYLDWEYGLVDQLARDGTHGFYVI
jgi:predicted metal-dependent enzyme (double-stranded beta helix superfamily)/rhodanese-related sulfurtransferase